MITDSARLSPYGPAPGSMSPEARPRGAEVSSQAEADTLIAACPATSKTRIRSRP